MAMYAIQQLALPSRKKKKTEKVKNDRQTDRQSAIGPGKSMREKAYEGRWAAEY